MDELAYWEELVDQGVIGNPNLTPEQNKRLVRSVLEHGNLAPRQLLQWVKSTAYYTAKLAEVSGEVQGAEITTFWLRVYGLFHEIREDFRGKLKTFEEVSAGRPVQSPAIEHLKAALSAIDKAWALFSEDDLLYVKYRRDNEAHVWQDAYRLSVIKKGKAIRETCRVYGREWNIDDLNERIRQVLLKYQVNEDGIAIDFARRIHRVMPEVLAACTRYCSP